MSWPTHTKPLPFGSGEIDHIHWTWIISGSHIFSLLCSSKVFCTFVCKPLQKANFSTESTACTSPKLYSQKVLYLRIAMKNTKHLCIVSRGIKKAWELGESFHSRSIQSHFGTIPYLYMCENPWHPSYCKVQICHQKKRPLYFSFVFW